MQGYAALLYPLVTFIVVGGLAIWLYFLTRLFWRTVLDSSRVVRFLYVTIAVVVLPLILGGWSDIADVSEIVKGEIGSRQTISLCFIAIIFVGYLYLHGCWFDREESGLVTRKNELGRIAEIDCQKNYLVRLLENFRACIGQYGERLQVAIDGSQANGSIALSLPNDLARDNIRMMVEAVRQTYKSVETVPKDSSIKALLLEERDGFLEHVESYDGTTWDCDKDCCDDHRALYFDLSSPFSSAAVASARTNAIQIIEDCDNCHKDDSHPFWFFQDCLKNQKDELGSMLIVPISLNKGQKFILCLSCSQPFAFLEKHLWKAKAVRENLHARFGLLFCQTIAFDSLQAEISELRSNNEDLKCETASLTHDLTASRNEVNRKQAQILHLEENQAQLSDELVKIKDSLNGEIATQLSVNLEKTNENALLLEENQSFSKEIELLKAKNAMLSEQLEKAKPRGVPLAGKPAPRKNRNQKGAGEDT